MIAGIMGYYPPEAAAMFYNPYSYVGGQLDQTAAQPQFAGHQQLDYQLTPALYLLNQQAELLQRSLAKAHAKKPAEGMTTAGSNSTNKPQRKQRGPYKKRTNKTLSPTVSPAPEFATESERLSSSDLSSSSSSSSNNNRSITSSAVQSDHLPACRDTAGAGAGRDQQTLRKRKSDSFLELDQPQDCKHNTRTLAHKQSIFRNVALMAVSSCTAQHAATVVQC
ncbi:uncharacterized protein LOC118513976 [Anopheles stephensi]|uniref:uncharacterized protein LOC118513976 n=1 Tax=Anopheles stephensi TaxID=30069 RepID=UPI001658AD20|nr:uncharacterized protein LOC118513976 [Anopheles stephensi]